MKALLQQVTEEKYEMKLSVRDAAILLASNSEPKSTVKLTLTSPLMRANLDDPEAKQGQLCIFGLMFWGLV